MMSVRFRHGLGHHVNTISEDKFVDRIGIHIDACIPQSILYISSQLPKFFCINDLITFLPLNTDT